VWGGGSDEAVSVLRAACFECNDVSWHLAEATPFVGSCAHTLKLEGCTFPNVRRAVGFWVYFLGLGFSVCACDRPAYHTVPTGLEVRNCFVEEDH
jgi:hypothetical protein